MLTFLSYKENKYHVFRVSHPMWSWSDSVSYSPCVFPMYKHYLIYFWHKHINHNRATIYIKYSVCLEAYRRHFQLSPLNWWTGMTGCLHLQVILLLEIHSRCLAWTVSTDFHRDLPARNNACQEMILMTYLLLRLFTRPVLDI